MGGLSQFLKPRITKLIKVHNFCGIIYRMAQITRCLLGVQFLKPKLQFAKLLTEFGVPQLPEDVVSKDATECHKCYDDRCAPNCKLISF